MRTIWQRCGLGIAVLTVAGAGWAWRAHSPGAATYRLDPVRVATPLPHRLRSPEEHDVALARVGNPYVLEIARGEGELAYYGARHSQDPADPQIADLRARWDAFEPTAALCEGRRRGYFLGPPFEWIAGLPEPALVHALARRDGVPLYSLEPDYASEVALLLRQFSARDVALYFTLRVYMSEAQGEENEALFRDLLAKRTDVDGLRTAFADPAAAQEFWRAEYAQAGPLLSRTSFPPRLSEIDHASRLVRGEHMARVLIELVERGERVFAVVGSGHVIRQEWALRAALGAQPAIDQPDAP